jgi:hypothetical protein
LRSAEAPVSLRKFPNLEAVEVDLSRGGSRRNDLVRTDSSGVIMQTRNYHQFVRFGLRNEALQTLADSLRRSHERMFQHACGLEFFRGIPVCFDVLDWRLEFSWGTAQKIGK